MLLSDANLETHEVVVLSFHLKFSVLMLILHMELEALSPYHFLGSFITLLLHSELPVST